MANQWLSDQLNTIYSGFLGGVATAGIAGGPILPRVTELRGIPKIHRFTVEQATPNPVPNNPAGTVATGDLFVFGWCDPTERIYFGRFYFNAWGGTAPTLSVGKLDLNNSANTDAAHYLVATAITAAGTADFNLNIGEQVGVDPIGDQTVGQQIPEFGSNKVWITGTLGGTLGSNGTINGFFITVEEGN